MTSPTTTQRWNLMAARLKRSQLIDTSNYATILNKETL